MWDATDRLLPYGTTLLVFVQIINITATATTVVNILNIFLVQVASTHVLVGATVATLTSGHPITLSPEIHPETPWCHFLCTLSRLLPSIDLLAGLVEVLGGVVRRAEGRSVEIVEHQIHVFCLLVLQVVPYLDVTVNLDLDVGISLA